MLGTEDYVRTTGSLVFTPADGSKSVTVVIRDDDVVEYQERFFMALSVSDNEGGVVFTGSRRAAITIANDDCEKIKTNCRTLKIRVHVILL